MTTQDVHKLYAITFITPSYDLKNGEESKTVMLQLVKPSDGSASEPIEFTFMHGYQAALPSMKEEFLNDEYNKAPRQVFSPVDSIQKVEKGEANNKGCLLPLSNPDNQV